MSIALALMVKDEADNIEAVLDSFAGLYDHAFVTDVGSTDGTRALVRDREDATLSTCDYEDHFADARNYNFEQVPSDYEWILWADADDRVLDDDAPATLRSLLDGVGDDVSAVDLPYIWSHSEHTDAADPEVKYYRTRVIRNGHCTWRGFVHEYPEIHGERVMEADGPVVHHMSEDRADSVERNLRLFEQHAGGFDDDEPRYRFYYAKELTYADRDDDALEQFERYLEIGTWDPQRAHAQYEIAEIHWQRGHHDTAREHALSAIHEQSEQSRPYTLLSQIAYDRGNYQTAYLWAHHAYHSPDPDTRFFDYIAYGTWRPQELMAWSRYKQGHHDVALEHLEVALDHAPENEHLQNTRRTWLGA